MSNYVFMREEGGAVTGEGATLNGQDKSAYKRPVIATREGKRDV